MEVASSTQRYVVGEQVANAKKYHLYVCTQAGIESQGLLQIATEVTQNGSLDRAAYILRELKRRSDQLEAEYAKVRDDPNVLLNYSLMFPTLIDSFVCSEQGGRRVNVVAFRNVDRVSNMIPLVNITAKDRLRVDVRTSAWIMGKLLKLLTFIHTEGISVGLMNGGNVLIEPNQHYVLVFDWSAAQLHNSGVPLEVRRKEIAKAAQAVITVLGGDLKIGKIPDDGEEGFDRYVDYLLRLARGNESKAERAHETFYELVDTIWKRGYHPFTTTPL